jgi:nicotinamide mononucleotide transporter
VWLSAVTSFFLRRYTPAAWPFVDSLVTWASVFATFLVARKVYENWHWWLLIDSTSVGLYFTRHLYLTMLLYALYLVLIALGMREWRRSLPQGRGPTAEAI